jgi:hypothetical protein
VLDPLQKTPAGTGPIVTGAIGGAPPPSVAPSADALDDGMSAMYASLSEIREGDVSLGTSRVDEDQAASKEERAEQQAAIKKEEANQATSGRGFLSSIGHLFGDVASDVVHGHFGRAVDDAGRDLESAWDSQKFWHELETGLAGVATVAGAVATAGLGGAVGVTALCVGAAAGAGAGLAEARVEDFAGAAQDASADATEAQQQVDRLQQMTTDVLSDVEQTDESQERAQQALTQAIETNDLTRVAAASTTMRG